MGKEVKGTGEGKKKKKKGEFHASDKPIVERKRRNNCGIPLTSLTEFVQRQAPVLNRFVSTVPHIHPHPTLHTEQEIRHTSSLSIILKIFVTLF
jgi:hypothetical protein